MMSAELTEAELDAIAAAAAALPPPQRAEFRSRVTSELQSLPPALLGPGTLHRVIASCQKTFLDVGMIAVGPRRKSWKYDAIKTRTKLVREV